MRTWHPWSVAVAALVALHVASACMKGAPSRMCMDLLKPCKQDSDCDAEHVCYSPSNICVAKLLVNFIPRILSNIKMGRPPTDGKCPFAALIEQHMSRVETTTTHHWRPELTTRPTIPQWRPQPTTRPTTQRWRPQPTARPTTPQWRPRPTARPTTQRWRPQPTTRPTTQRWRPQPTTRPTTPQWRPRPTARNRAILTVKVQDAQTNRALSNVTVLFLDASAGARRRRRRRPLSVRTDATGRARVRHFAVGTVVRIVIRLDGFLQRDRRVTVSARNQEILFSMSKRLDVEDVRRAVLNWRDLPKDFDLHVMQMDGTTGKLLCEVSFENGKCEDIELDVDNRMGGRNGAETVTWSRSKSSYVYGIYVHDFSGDAKHPLSVSGAFVSIWDNRGRKKKVSVPSGQRQRFWLVGCLFLSAGVDRFHELNTLTNRDPYVARDMCANIGNNKNTSKNTNALTPRWK